MNDLVPITAVQIGFDWSAEITETQYLLNELSDTLQRAEDIAVKIGRKFLQFQEALPHGEFLPFLDAEFGMSRATAYNFIGLAETEREEPDKFLIIRNYPLYLQYRLAPAPMAVVKQVESGEVPATVKAIQEAKREAKAAKEAQRQAEERAKQLEQETTRALAEQEQKQLALFKEHDTLRRAEIARLTSLMEAQEAEIARLQEQPEQIVDTPETIARLAELEALQKKLKEERDRKAERVEVLTKEVQKYVVISCVNNENKCT